MQKSIMLWRKCHNAVWWEQPHIQRWEGDLSKLAALPLKGKGARFNNDIDCFRHIFVWTSCIIRWCYHVGYAWWKPGETGVSGTEVRSLNGSAVKMMCCTVFASDVISNVRCRFLMISDVEKKKRNVGWAIITDDVIKKGVLEMVHCQWIWAQLYGLWQCPGWFQRNMGTFSAS